MGVYASTAWGQAASDVICSGCVQGTDIENGTIGPNKLIPGSINASTIANQSIGPNKLIPGSINASTIANQSIGSNKLIPGSINTSVIGTGAVTGNKIAAGAVTLDKLAADVQVKLSGQILSVDCTSDDLQAVIDGAASGSTIFVNGTCSGSFSLTKDDILLSGNEAEAACNKANPSASAGGTISGTLDVVGVRAHVEFLELTGPDEGLIVRDSAAVEAFCNDISANAASGVAVVNASFARLIDNTVSGNGTRIVNPFVFFDSGLFVADNSSVRSTGNSYEDNQYAAVDVERQGSFRSGSFLPRQAGNPPDPDERDTIVELGCDISTGIGCSDDDGGPVAIEVFNQGLVDIRNADIGGQIEAVAGSSFRVDGDATVQGDIVVQSLSLARLQDRSEFGDRLVTFDGLLFCDITSTTFFSDVLCNQDCTGTIPGGCTTVPGR